ncbi:MAG: hypothetical protein QHH13_02550 [Melioribacter sp.]|nr:hypothetical protein [Melioribacter sp.]
MKNLLKTKKWNKILHPPFSGLIITMGKKLQCHSERSEESL